MRVEEGQRLVHLEHQHGVDTVGDGADHGIHGILHQLDEITDRPVQQRQIGVQQVQLVEHDRCDLLDQRQQIGRTKFRQDGQQILKPGRVDRGQDRSDFEIDDQGKTRLIQPKGTAIFKADGQFKLAGDAAVKGHGIQRGKSGFDQRRTAQHAIAVNVGIGKFEAKDIRTRIGPGHGNRKGADACCRIHQHNTGARCVQEGIHARHSVQRRHGIGNRAVAKDNRRGGPVCQRKVEGDPRAVERLG